MSLALNKIILAGATTNTPGAYVTFANMTATTVGNTIPAGLYTVLPTANVTINVATAINATGNITGYSLFLANNTGGLVFSDGVNFSANATSNTTVVMLTVTGGQPVSGTFNNV